MISRSCAAAGGCLALDRRTFDTVMPDTVTQFDDELQTIGGPLTDATDPTVGGGRLLAARAITRSQARTRSTPCGRRSRPRLDIDGGRPVPAVAPEPPLSDQRPAQCA